MHLIILNSFVLGYREHVVVPARAKNAFLCSTVHTPDHVGEHVYVQRGGGQEGATNQNLYFRMCACANVGECVQVSLSERVWVCVYVLLFFMCSQVTRLARSAIPFQS